MDASNAAEINNEDFEITIIPSKSVTKSPPKLTPDQYERSRSKQVTTNFKNLLSALALFEYMFTDDKSKDDDIVANLKFEIDESFTDLSASQLYYLGMKCEHKAVVVAISSKDGEKISIYWKSKELQHFLTFKAYNGMIFREYKELFDFIINFLVTSLRIGHLGVFNQLFIQHEMHIVELHFLADSRNFNLLLIAAEQGNPLVVKNLLNFNITTNSPIDGINAQRLAYHHRHYSVLYHLLEQNLPYPYLFDVNHSSIEIKNFLGKSTELHKMILDKNEAKIVEILSKNPNCCHFFNAKNESAATIAVKSKQLDIYKLLLSHNVWFGVNEDIDGIIGDLSENLQSELKEIHKKFSKELPEKHINVLLANSTVGPDETSAEPRLDLLKSAFLTLNDIPLVKTILVIVAASRNFQIIFDFKRGSKNLADPASDLPYKCILHSSNILYINIWQIIHETTRNEALGTIAHEFCHYALNMIYDNLSKPYVATDQATRDKFRIISQFCYTNCDKDEAIKQVYQYPRHMQHAELIARVFYLLAKYHDQPDKLEDIQNNFRPLFDIYKAKIKVEMESALVDIENSATIEGKLGKKSRKGWIIAGGESITYECIKYRNDIFNTYRRYKEPNWI
ncbi:uncharacterized protein [Chironomus tepperi]|uniref:uncharacterized protein n=1 Tax=Chironomus tepperi TaxID=113505 RepID=UPI00391F4650